MRLNKYLSDAGVCSRREADRLVQDGRVMVDGKTAVLGMQIQEGQEILVNGKKVRREEKKVLLLFHKPRAVSYTHLDVYKRQVVEKTFRPTEKFPQARIDRVDMQYLYNDGDLYYFMNNETYDQIAIDDQTVGDALKFVKENETVKVCSYNGNVFAIEAPLFVELDIIDTEPGFKGCLLYTSGQFLFRIMYV